MEIGDDVGLLEGTAEEIARANQAMDEDWYYHPFNVVTGTWRHFRAREAVMRDLDSAVASCDPVTFGRHLHSYQDTFSHAGFYWPWTLGHVPYSAGVAVVNTLPGVAIADPDDYNPNSRREKDMTFGTMMWLLIYRRNCQCGEDSQ